MDNEWTNIKVIPCRTRDGDLISVIKQQYSADPETVRYVTGSGKAVEKLDDKHLVITCAGIAITRE